ncbi:AfsR/SARP family transcriptional regulator [Umezawaea tangerina]|uniref:DNA-binding SARP family transcriptional activator n=1 Tax=Umezawaea tangerina TaxID=84725 RepID=A0A2T0SSJ6_9PSEU|nr:tetratricopeptide repeat protein [Umezawaea tangerina]PRY36384.1 DNA-binding SARP family transcriptional activator [Umezawaea tangerina]
MEFRILGKTRLRVDGNDLSLGPAKQRGLLALLLYEVDKPVLVERIAQTLWHGSPAEKVRGNLQVLISRLRRVLSDSGSGGTVPKEGDAYRLQIDPLLIDYHLFRKLAEEGEAAAANGNHALAKSLLLRALSLWHGRPLEDLSGPWAEHCRYQMENFDRLPAYYTLFNSQLELEEHLQVMSGTGKIRQDHEFDEIFARQHMQSLRGLGKYPHALEFHTHFSERLFDEMGAEPGPELRDLYQDVLRRQAGTGVAPVEQPAAGLSRPHQLPRVGRRFVGREDILAELDALADSMDDGYGQVVVLHGMPGVGKTSLAAHWANLSRDRFPDGELFLDLSGHGPGTPLAPHDALGILLSSMRSSPDHTPATGSDRRLELHKVLGQQRLLIILDNAKDSSQVHPLLQAMTNCFTIVTSRTRPWGLPIRDNAHVIIVPPLSPTESVKLLRNEIGNIRTAGFSGALQELAARTNGHPLGLRIIAQHVAHRPETAVADLVEEFKGQEGLGILGSSADSDDEDVTLPAAFSWSYRALAPTTARAFRLLGLHPTTEFGITVACALLGEDEQAVDSHLRTLTKANLLQHGAARRYRLHDLLHGYAVDLVRHEESPENRKRALAALLDWYLGSAVAAMERLSPDSPRPPSPDIRTVVPLDFVDESDALTWFTKEQANLMAAVPHSFRHGFPSHSWRLSAHLHEVMDRICNYTEMISCHRIALKAARLTMEEEAQSGTMNNLGMVHFRLEEYREAAYHIKAGLEIAKRLDLKGMQAICMHNLASVHLAQGQAGKAVDLYKQALERLQELGSRGGEASTLGQLANAYHELERDDLALELHHRALEIRIAIESHRGEATTRTELGKLLNQQGEHDQARAHLEAALKLHSHSGDRARTSEALTTIADVYYKLGLLDRSIASAELAIQHAGKINAPQNQFKALHTQGHALVLLGNRDAAEERWRRALTLLRDQDGPEADALLSHLSSLETTRDDIPEPRSSLIDGPTQPNRTKSNKQVENKT